MPPSPRSLTDRAFRAQLAAAVADVEGQSSAEVVVLVSARSGSYPEAGWILGLLALVVVFAVLMFHDAEVGDYTLFLGPLAAFGLGFAVPLVVPRARMLVASRAAVSRNVELVARASFQKAGLHATRQASALLVYVSLIERAVFLVADRGLTAALPEAWFVEARQRLSKAIRDRAPAPALLAATRDLAADLGRHLPRRPDDMNELPDAIDLLF